MKPIPYSSPLVTEPPWDTKQILPDYMGFTGGFYWDTAAAPNPFLGHSTLCCQQQCLSPGCAVWDPARDGDRAHPKVKVTVTASCW